MGCVQQEPVHQN
ncbi:hypothetical protein VULLAG_LOCUS23211 [Vulpes lagopus]